MRKNLESSLVEFSSAIITFTKNLKEDNSSKLLANQMLRSATSAALNYGETQNAQSKKELIFTLAKQHHRACYFHRFCAFIADGLIIDPPGVHTHGCRIVFNLSVPACSEVS